MFERIFGTREVKAEVIVNCKAQPENVIPHGPQETKVTKDTASNSYLSYLNPINAVKSANPLRFLPSSFLLGKKAQDIPSKLHDTYQSPYAALNQAYDAYDAAKNGYTSGGVENIGHKLFGAHRASNIHMMGYLPQPPSMQHMLQAGHDQYEKMYASSSKYSIGNIFRSKPPAPVAKLVDPLKPFHPHFNPMYYLQPEPSSLIPAVNSFITVCTTITGLLTALLAVAQSSQFKQALGYLDYYFKRLTGLSHESAHTLSQESISSGWIHTLQSALAPYSPWTYVKQKLSPSVRSSANLDYLGADEDYSDNRVGFSGITQDLKVIGPNGLRDLRTLMEVLASKGKPIDDKKMTMEKMIALTTSLPETSRMRHKLTCTIIDTLWDSLQHPPLSYLGPKFQYRTPDGSFNNIMFPDMGKAGMPYAKAVRSAKKLHGARPDPGVLFDLLMARGDTTFKENPAGISSFLFYHATIIIHDIFRTNRLDPTISDTSSYLDLAPLYGSSLADQEKIRTFKGGLLKPDTFHEKRLLAQPPGVNVVLVLYSRFHNYVAETLAKINEGGRFSLPANADDKAILKQDNDLFQTARLIVGGLYINISLHDYLRGLTNTHHSDSSWTLDPRIDISKQFDGQGVPRGVGNQVSAEFNLLYRFHSTISLRDEKWLNEFLQSLFPDAKKSLSELSPAELLQGLLKYEGSISADPSKRDFGGLKRGADGKFSDADLVRVIKDTCEDPAGLFGARMVPKALRVVEVLGILQSRKWFVACTFKQLAPANHDFLGKWHHSMSFVISLVSNDTNTLKISTQIQRLQQHFATYMTILIW